MLVNEDRNKIPFHMATKNIYEPFYMTAKEIYEMLHSIDEIAELETRNGVWYIENSIDEYRSKPSSYYPTLMECVEGLQKSCDWHCLTGTGTICFAEFGIGGIKIDIYSGRSSINDNNEIVSEWGRLRI